MKLTTQLRLMNAVGPVLAGLGASLGAVALILGEGRPAEALGLLSVVLIGIGAGLHWTLGGQELPPPEVAAVLESIDEKRKSSKR